MKTKFISFLLLKQWKYFQADTKIIGSSGNFHQRRVKYVICHFQYSCECVTITHKYGMKNMLNIFVQFFQHKGTVSAMSLRILFSRFFLSFYAVSHCKKLKK